MGERRSGYRDRGGGEQGRYWRPPRSHGNGNFSVPLWEKKFCTDACAIPWGKLCETKKLMSLYKNVVDWDDSAALETFNDAKARFCAVYHGQPCDIPLPDPNMYIDMVNQDEHVDPELVADLEKSRRSYPKRDNTAPDGWDSFIFTNKPVPATGWGDGETSNTPGQQYPTNWNNHVKQPTEANCMQSSVNWDNYVSQPPQATVQQSSGNWDMYVKQQDQANNWEAPTMPGTWDMKGDSLDAWKRDSGWGSAAIDSWDNHRENCYVPDSQGWSYGHWKRRNNESSRRNSRGRDRVGPISSKAMKPKYHSEERNGANNGWRHCRVRNNMQYSYENPGCNQSLAM
ncbi:unknown protein [Oryza sativa Japonica Group]|uniref:Os01g0801200 protein n=3 Tax=Oryza TaxID=4527 RepID=A0A0P0V999_ORYSJ|nr:uncharacterized protein LOC4327962 [Oryza sativa Japonica Group]KAB8083915.1 hypothetical protein EE612_006312 [Oryza sativa]EEE55542.1 hypothetical protein OsJ_03776 [Oryza sativa Japonica Group]KAF2952836.1 hypothetical protein DAI22_01g366300 [Oryza sativa Japonica Group]BAD68139.1 unknown protein [Oryza sativa Japonica Group]BAD68288.1 unknown protein [Oryza sativa Japonica Group]|eukprot:NP_001044539.1 Os01g0801200 [Oryza sativa Japonica Group]